MTKKKKTTISDLGEFGLIRRLTDDIVIRHQSTYKGIGDDAHRCLLYTSDAADE